MKYEELLEQAKSLHKYGNTKVLEKGLKELRETTRTFVYRQSPQLVMKLATTDFRIEEFEFETTPKSIYDFAHEVIISSLVDDLFTHIDKRAKELRSKVDIPVNFDTTKLVDMKYPCVLSMEESSLMLLTTLKQNMQAAGGQTMEVFNSDDKWTLERAEGNSHIDFDSVKYIFSVFGSLTILITFEEGLQLKSIIDLTKLGV